MQSLLKLLFLLFFLVSFAQKNEHRIDTLKTDVLNAQYSVFNNTLLKKNSTKTYTYKNFMLGDISSVDITNTQEIVLFYADFNTTVLLDNQLNLKETIQFQNNISFSKKGIANTLWIFNADENKLQHYDYKSKKTLQSSQSITNFEPIEMESSLNFIKLIGKNKTLVFNQYLNLIDTIIHKKND